VEEGEERKRKVDKEVLYAKEKEKNQVRKRKISTINN
jgi:hypothetical protein